jgi:glycosyltransferase involved in cell wall biosynthesis
MTSRDTGLALDLSLVIPAFNEESRFDEGFARLAHVVDSGLIDAERTEFLVVDDGSTDHTAERAEQLFSRFPHVKVLRLPHNSGKGAAVRTGVAAAQGAAVVFADADMAVDPEQIPALVEALQTAEVAIASRTMAGSSAHFASARRTMMGRAFNLLVNAITHISIKDTQCGFKGFRTPAAKVLFECSTIDRFAFDVEVLCLARRFGLRITEVPVRWRNVGASRIRPVADPYSMIKDVLRARSGAGDSKIISSVAVTADNNMWADRQSQVVEWAGDNLVVKAPGDHDAIVLFTEKSVGSTQRFRDGLAANVPGVSSQELNLRVSDLRKFAPFEILNPYPATFERGKQAEVVNDSTKQGANSSSDTADLASPHNDVGASRDPSIPSSQSTPGQRAVAGF